MRRWATMLSLQQMSTDRPSQLMVSSLVRARMCEMLAEPLGLGRRKVDLYLLGLLSLMDVVLSCSMEEVLSRLPVAKDVYEALTNETGPLQGVHLTVTAFEQNRVAEAWRCAEKFGIDPRQLGNAYLAATHWVDEVLGTL